MSSYSILVFAYKRASKLKENLQSLYKNEGAENLKVTICVDGLNDNDKEDEVQVENQKELLNLVYTYVEDKGVKAIFNEGNLGIKKQYLSKMELLLSESENLIVIEEDAIVGKYFLNYMDKAFDKFGKSERVIMLGGYTYSNILYGKRNSCFFLIGSGNKAFGITRTFWQNIDFNCTGWEELKTNKKLKRKYNVPGVDAAAVLVDEIENDKNVSWDSIFLYNSFRKGLLMLNPDNSLVMDNGWGADAVNCVGENLIDYETFQNDYQIHKFPKYVKEDKIKKVMHFLNFAICLRLVFRIDKIKKQF